MNHLVKSMFIGLIMIISGYIVRAQKTITISSCPADSVTAWMNISHVPVVGIGLIEDGKVKSVVTYGELRAGVPATVNSLWNVASLAKPVSAVTVLSLVNKGLWNLDEAVSKYWVEPDIKDNPWTGKLTTRLLLSHQAGFPNWRWGDSSKKLSFRFEPGTGMKYSGEGYEYLRRSVEAKFGKSLQALALEQLFSAIHLTNTRYSWTDELDSTQYVEPYDKAGNKYTYNKSTTVNAADWLITTISDYTRFGLFVIKGAGLSPKLYDDMTMVHGHFDTTTLNRSNGMGLGWQVIKDLPSNEFALTHSGSDPGIATFILLLPKSKRGIVIFTNGDNGGVVRSNILKAIKLDIAPELSKYMRDFR